jgi:hypothetical protein
MNAIGESRSSSSSSSGDQGDFGEETFGERRVTVNFHQELCNAGRTFVSKKMASMTKRPTVNYARKTEADIKIIFHIRSKKVKLMMPVIHAIFHELCSHDESLVFKATSRKILVFSNSEEMCESILKYLYENQVKFGCVAGECLYIQNTVDYKRFVLVTITGLDIYEPEKHLHELISVMKCIKKGYLHSFSIDDRLHAILKFNILPLDFVLLSAAGEKCLFPGDPSLQFFVHIPPINV